MQEQIEGIGTNRKDSGTNMTNAVNVDSSSDTIMVWSLDKNAWRDIRSDTITEWRVENE